MDQAKKSGRSTPKSPSLEAKGPKSSQHLPENVKIEQTSSSCSSPEKLRESQSGEGLVVASAVNEESPSKIRNKRKFRPETPPDTFPPSSVSQDHPVSVAISQPQPSALGSQKDGNCTGESKDSVQNFGSTSALQHPELGRSDGVVDSGSFPEWSPVLDLEPLHLTDEQLRGIQDRVLREISSRREVRAHASAVPLGTTSSPLPSQSPPLIRAIEPVESTCIVGPRRESVGWDDGTEERLEELLLERVKSAHEEAVARIIGFGYSEEEAQKAADRFGSCFGERDVASNIVANALNPLVFRLAAHSQSSGATQGSGASASSPGLAVPGYPCSETSSSSASPAHVPALVPFSSKEELHKDGLARMLYVLQAVRGPEMSRGDAMWALLITDLHLARACEVQMPPSVHEQPDTQGHQEQQKQGGDRAGEGSAKVAQDSGTLVKSGSLIQGPVAAQGGDSTATGTAPATQTDISQPVEAGSLMQSILRQRVAMQQAGIEEEPAPQPGQMTALSLQLMQQLSAHFTSAVQQQKQQWAQEGQKGQLQGHLDGAPATGSPAVAGVPWSASQDTGAASAADLAALPPITPEDVLQLLMVAHAPIAPVVGQARLNQSPGADKEPVGAPCPGNVPEAATSNGAPCDTVPTLQCGMPPAASFMSALRAALQTTAGAGNYFNLGSGAAASKFTPDSLGHETSAVASPPGFVGASGVGFGGGGGIAEKVAGGSFSADAAGVVFEGPVASLLSPAVSGVQPQAATSGMAPGSLPPTPASLSLPLVPPAAAPPLAAAPANLNAATAAPTPSPAQVAAASSLQNLIASKNAGSRSSKAASKSDIGVTRGESKGKGAGNEKKGKKGGTSGKGKGLGSSSLAQKLAARQHGPGKKGGAAGCGGGVTVSVTAAAAVPAVAAASTAGTVGPIATESSASSGRGGSLPPLASLPPLSAPIVSAPGVDAPGASDGESTTTTFRTAMSVAAHLPLPLLQSALQSARDVEGIMRTSIKETGAVDMQRLLLQSLPPLGNQHQLSEPSPAGRGAQPSLSNSVLSKPGSNPSRSLTYPSTVAPSVAGEGLSPTVQGGSADRSNRGGPSEGEMATVGKDCKGAASKTGTAAAAGGGGANTVVAGSTDKDISAAASDRKDDEKAGNGSTANGLSQDFVQRFEQLNLTYEQCVLLEQRVAELEAQAGEHKDDTVQLLQARVVELEKQLEERKQWARQRVMQAVEKLVRDSEELKALRAEKEEAGRQKKERAVAEEGAVKKLAEVEGALRKASGQVEKTNAAMRRLEAENAEVRAEMQAANLRAAELNSKLAEGAKKDGKATKKANAWEKVKAKLQEELGEEKRRNEALVAEAQKAKEQQQKAEAKRREAERAKQEAVEAAESAMATAVEAVEQAKGVREAGEAEVRRVQEEKRRAEDEAKATREEVQKLHEEVVKLQRQVQQQQMPSQKPLLEVGL